MGVRRELEPIKGSRCFLEQETLSSMLSTVGSTDGLERDFTIELEQFEGFIID